MKCIPQVLYTLNSAWIPENWMNWELNELRIEWIENWMNWELNELRTEWIENWMNREFNELRI